MKPQCNMCFRVCHAVICKLVGDFSEASNQEEMIAKFFFPGSLVS